MSVANTLTGELHTPPVLAAVSAGLLESLALEIMVTAAAGTEAVVKRELEALGYSARTAAPSRLLFSGDLRAICRANLWLRAAVKDGAVAAL